MSRPRPDIDYLQLCKAFEEGDKVKAYNSILNNVNVDCFNTNDRYNWAHIIYEILELSTIFKVFEKEDQVITRELLLENKFFSNVKDHPEQNREAESLFHFLNIFRNCIRCTTFTEGEVVTQQLNLTELMRHYSDGFNNPLGWNDIITKIFKQFINKAFQEDPNASEFQKWIGLISETLDISIGLFNNKTNAHNNYNDHQILNVAIQKNNTLQACLLIRRGTFLERDFIVLLLGAIEYNNDIVAQVLIDHRMQNSSSINLLIPLNITVLQRQSKIIEHIIPHCPFLKSSDQCNDEQVLLSLKEEVNKHLQIPGNSYMYDAVKNRYSNIARLLLDYNPDIQYISPDGDTVLHKAIENHFDVEFIETLLKLNPPVNVANHKKHTPLHIACRIESADQLKIIEKLICYGANINCTDDDLMTPLHMACQTQNLEMVKVLLEKGANSNAENNKKQTPLHVVYGSHGEYMSTMTMDNILMIVKLLLKYHANIDAVDVKGWTVLFEACKMYHNEAVEFLLENGANAHHTDLENLNSLHIAIQNCFVDTYIVELLLKHKVNTNGVNKLGQSMIHLIVEDNLVTLIDHFADTKINFNTVDKQGNSPLHIAIEKQSIGGVKNLLKYGADVNVLDANKCTPLQKALQSVSYHQKKRYDDEFLRQWSRKNHLTHITDTCALRIEYNIKELFRRRKIVRILRKQIIKLKTARLKINSQNLDLLYKFDDSAAGEDDMLYFRQFKVECREEIEILKTEQTGLNGITFYDLLMKNNNFLSRFTRNKNIQRILKSQTFAEKFPLYVDILEFRFRDIKLRNNLINVALMYFRLHVYQRLPDNCVDTVLSYLEVEDVEAFIRAVNPLSN